ncbi:hypothetical protein TIFTF001_023615 [Ficus carica]|uniref:Uncharacterized protein n=1 Tax=Ficus carica TaxID=3494 RepID=A0AA88AM19_FICCA|nr:hypothetical protein TIFTF001_023615 [Ficus carica]
MAAGTSRHRGEGGFCSRSHGEVGFIRTAIGSVGFVPAVVEGILHRDLLISIPLRQMRFTQ